MAQVLIERLAHSPPRDASLPAAALVPPDELRRPTKDQATIQSVEVTGGSIRGFANIEAPGYQEALSLVCRNTPVIDLEWHLEERVNPAQVESILEEAMRA